MSKISDLGEKYCNLPKMLETYDKILSQADDDLCIVGKRLEISNSQNSALLHFYDQRRVELHTLVKFFKTEEDRVKGRLYKSYKENHSRSLGEREIAKYIDNEDAYIEAHSLLIEVEETYEMFQGVVNALTTRNYALSNITKLRVASLENIEI